jgi:hypothetical protein
MRTVFFIFFFILLVLTSEERHTLFPPILPSFVRFCKAFPPLIEDIVSLLLQYGRICASEARLKPLTLTAASTSPRNTTDSLTCNGFNGDHDQDLKPLLLNGSIITNNTKEVHSMMDCLPVDDVLCNKVKDTFVAILGDAILEKRLY